MKFRKFSRFLGILKHHPYKKLRSMENRNSYEKLSIRDSAKALKKYGSTSSKYSTRNENFIKHTVSSADTLQGIALKYGVTVSSLLMFSS